MTEIITVPLSKLTTSDTNMRKTGRDIGLDELAASIAAQGLLQNLTVRPVLDAENHETGQYEVVAGGRRFAALKVLAKRKTVAKTLPVPCALLGARNPTEISLAENLYVPPHPADQFEAFRRLADEGLPAVEIAARFGITERVVRQRLRLGAVSPQLMAQYREGLLNLEQLTAFALTDDHARQEQVWRDLSWNKSAEFIRRTLTQAHAAATDRRAMFVGVAAYEAAGGLVLRDLFSDDERDVYLEDVALLDRLVREKLEAEAEAVRAEGWKWIEVHAEFAYGMAAGLRRIYPEAIPLTAAEQDRLDAAMLDQEQLSGRLDSGDDALEVTEGLDRLDAEIDALRGREAYDPAEIARAGAFVCLGHDGEVRIERGFVRPEDEPSPEDTEIDSATTAGHDAALTGDAAGIAYAPDTGEVPSDAEPDEPEGLTPLSDRLVEDLTAQRTAGIQAVLIERPDMALAAIVHALALRIFYGAGYNPETCLRIEAAPVDLLGPVGTGLAAREIGARHNEWSRHLPRAAGELWIWTLAQDTDTLLGLLAYCAARTVYAVNAPWNHDPKRLGHADALAANLDLDMTRYWSPTVESYFGRVTKARIVEAVREGVSDEAAQRIVGMKKQPMAEAAEQLLAETGWLPALLRTKEATTRPGQIGETPDLAAAAE